MSINSLCLRKLIILNYAYLLKTKSVQLQTEQAPKNATLGIVFSSPTCNLVTELAHKPQP